MEKEETAGIGEAKTRSPYARASFSQKSEAALHLQKVWTATKQRDWPFTVLWPDLLPQRGGPNPKERVA